MAEIEEPENPACAQSQSNSASKNVDLYIGGNVEGSIVIGDHNYIVNNYYQLIEKNIKKHEPEYWALKHPYPMPPNFTGRVAERAMLTYWLKEDSENRLFILCAHGGFGKSALAWHWLTHDVDIKEYPKVLWWSFYEGDASFENFVTSALDYLGIDIPQGQRHQLDDLLKAMQREKVFFILDGFERALRAYDSMNAAYQGDEEPKLGDRQLDCVDINAVWFLRNVCSLPNLQSKVLLTTRLTPRAVKPRGEVTPGCREQVLASLQKEDAIEFFQKQKIRGSNAAIEIVCERFGYHPLSLRLLAGRIIKDFENPGDIIVAQKLNFDGDIIHQKHHILDVSYNSLPFQEGKLLSTIACFRSPVELKILEAIAENKNTLDDSLHNLVDRGLLQFNEKNQRFDIHPIVRHYAYERLTAPEQKGIHSTLVDFFAAVPQPQKIEKLEDLAPVIELYHHLVRAGEFAQACELFYERLARPTYYQFGAYQLRIELLSVLFPDREDQLPRLRNSNDQAWALNALATSYSLSGQPQRAAQLLEKQIAIRTDQGDNNGIVIGRSNLAQQQLVIGSFQGAKLNLQEIYNLVWLWLRSRTRQDRLWPRGLNEADSLSSSSAFDLAEEWLMSQSSEAKDSWLSNLNINPSINYSKEIIRIAFCEALERQELSRLQAYMGSWDIAEKEISVAIHIQNSIQQVQAQGVSWAYRALSAILKFRGSAQSKDQKNIESSIEAAQQALLLAERTRNVIMDTPVDFVRAHWLLGTAYRMAGNVELAERFLREALNRDRMINLVELEADILLEIARLHHDQKNYEVAKSFAEEALLITERCGYVLQGADVNLFLAQYALEQEQNKAEAKEYAESALKLAYCDGPPYYYKVAYEEAERMLEILR